MIIAWRTTCSSIFNRSYGCAMFSIHYSISVDIARSLIFLILVWVNFPLDEGKQVAHLAEREVLLLIDNHLQLATWPVSSIETLLPSGSFSASSASSISSLTISGPSSTISDGLQSVGFDTAPLARLDRHSATQSAVLHCTGETPAATSPACDYDGSYGCSSTLSSASHSDTPSATDSRLSVSSSGALHSTVLSGPQLLPQVASQILDAQQLPSQLVDLPQAVSQILYPQLPPSQLVDLLQVISQVLYPQQPPSQLVDHPQVVSQVLYPQ